MISTPPRPFCVIGSLRWRICAYPKMPLRGVRNSWLMLAKNSLLARLAPSAISFACWSSTVRSSTRCSSSRLVFSRAVKESRSCCAMSLKDSESTPNSFLPETSRVRSNFPEAIADDAMLNCAIGSVIKREV